MDFNFFNTLSNLIEREKLTANMLYSFRNFDSKILTESLKHNQSLYKLLKLYSRSGFIVPIEEPDYIQLELRDAVNICIDDLEFYRNFIGEDNELVKIIPELISTKLYLLKTVNNNILNRLRNLTLQELSQYNGMNGYPSYVAVNGVIYDVTNSPSWMEGVHFELSPGQDLTMEFSSCHGSNTGILSNLPVVGRLIGG